MSGRAFDNNCNCFELQNIQKHICLDSFLQSHSNNSNNNNNINSENKENFDLLWKVPAQIKQNFECVCNAPRLAPEIEFTKALISIGKKLVRIATKELKTQRLMSELAIVNMNLPARVWLPLYDFPHHIVRIPYRSAAVLNSKEKAPYIMYVEVLECDDIHCTPLPPKLLDNNLVNYSQSTNNLNTNSINEESQLMNNNDQSSSQLDSSDQPAKKPSSPKSVKSLSTDISICSAPTLLLNNNNLSNNKTGTVNTNLNNNDSIVKNDSINNTNNHNNNNSVSQIESDLWSVYSDSFLPTKMNSNHLNNGTNGNGMSHHNNNNYNNKYLSSKLQSDNISIDSYMSDSRLDQASIASSSMCNITFISASEIRKRLEVDNVYTSKSGVSAIRDPDDPSMNALREPWLEKQARIRESSPYGHYPNWKLLPVIIKVIIYK
jgi:hypothetical protein